MWTGPIRSRAHNRLACLPLRPPVPPLATKRTTARIGGGSLVGLVALAAALRLHGLGSQLWLDEMDALLESIRRPAADIMTRWPATTSHVLYDLCSHASVRALGETALAVRLPAALFGVGGVAALFLFTQPVLGRRVATVAGALLAVSYHHVFYSQNARGYTALLLLRARRRAWIPAIPIGPRSAWATGPATSSPARSPPIPWSLASSCSRGTSCWRRAGGRRPVSRRPPWPLRGRRVRRRGGHGGGAIALLYAPFADHLLRFTERQARLPAAAEDGHGHRGPVARLGVTADAIEGLGRGFGGRAGLAVAALVASIGTASSGRAATGSAWPSSWSRSPSSSRPCWPRTCRSVPATSRSPSPR